MDADPQGDLTKMLGMSKPNDLPLTLGDVMAISHRMPASVSVQKHCSIQGVFQYMKHILGRKGNIY